MLLRGGQACRGSCGPFGLKWDQNGNPNRLVAIKWDRNGNPDRLVAIKWDRDGNPNRLVASSSCPSL